ncbi:MAG: hypothetical protein IPK17_17940, partial [Chloroflexi bacterium]|nr:hypothetical protein [Chloroflexota bacterium]
GQEHGGGRQRCRFDPVSGLSDHFERPLLRRFDLNSSDSASCVILSWDSQCLTR